MGSDFLVSSISIESLSFAISMMSCFANSPSTNIFGGTFLYQYVCCYVCISEAMVNL